MKSALYLCAAAALMFGAAQNSTASVIGTPTVFDVQGFFSDDATLTGTITIDTTFGTVLSADLFVNSLEFNNISSGGELIDLESPDVNIWSPIDLTSPTDRFASLQIGIFLGSATSLSGYAGGALCVDLGDFTGNCGSNLSRYDLNSDPFLTSGSLSISGAPEPSTVFLLAGPVAFFAIRRRFAR